MQVELEKYIPEVQGLIDVAVFAEDDRRVVAIEIALSNKYSHEVDNIEKCQRAGFKKIISAAPNEFILKGIKQEALNRGINLDNVEFRLLSGFYNALHKRKSKQLNLTTIK